MILPQKYSLKNLLSINSWFIQTIVLLSASILLSITITKPFSKVPFIYLFVFPSIIILLQPKVGIWFILIFVFYISYLADEIFLIPGTVIWMLEVSIAAMLLSGMHKFLFDKNEFKRTPVDILLLFLLLEGLLSGLLNHASPVSTILGCRKLFKLVLLFYLLIHFDFKEDFYKKVINFFYITALVQGPIALTQFMVWSPELEYKMVVERGLGGWSRVDFSAGTTGISGITAIYSIGFICFTLGFMLNDKVRLHYVIKLILLVMPILIGSSRSGFIYLPVMIVFMLRKTLFTNVKKGIIVGVAFCIGYVILIKSASLFGYDLAGFLLSPGDQIAEQSHFSAKGQPVGRVANVIFAYNLLNQSLLNIFIGFGPNSVSLSAFGSGFEGKVLSYLLENDMVTRATSFINSQIAFMLLEWGFLGFGIYLAVIVKIYLMNMRFYKAIGDPYWQKVSFGFSGIIVLYVITIFYKTVWVMEPTVCMFWGFAGVIFAVGKKRGVF